MFPLSQVSICKRNVPKLPERPFSYVRYNAYPCIHSQGTNNFTLLVLHWIWSKQDKYVHLFCTIKPLIRRLDEWNVSALIAISYYFYDQRDMSILVTVLAGKFKCLWSVVRKMIYFYVRMWYILILLLTFHNLDHVYSKQDIVSVVIVNWIKYV